MNNTKNTKVRELKDLPSPEGTWLAGNLSKFKQENKHQVMEDWVEEVGEKVFSIRLLSKKFIVSADHELNNEVLKKRPQVFRRFSKIDEIMSEMGIKGVFNAEGETWKQHRKITAEALNLKNVNAYFPTLTLVTNRLRNRLMQLAEKGQRIDIQKEMMRYTVDMTTLIAFGYDTDTLSKDQDAIQEHLERIFPMINKRIASPIPVWRYLKSKEDKALDTSLVEIRKTILDFIDAAKEKLATNPELKENPSNFLEAMLVEKEKEGSFSDEEIYGNVFTMLLAGEDTTSNSISWLCYYLCQHPEAVEKIRQEVRDVYGDDAILPNSSESLSQLTYTEGCINEAMRLKPVTPSLYMECLEDITIKDVKIEKGMTVMMQNKVAQTDEANFTHADSFEAERWAKSKCPMHQNHSPNLMRAFGAGPRFCPGKFLAINEMKMAAVMLVTYFDMSLAVQPEEVKERFSFTMYPENLFLRLEKKRVVQELMV